MDNLPEIVPIRQRRYQDIPCDRIKVINPRNRDAEPNRGRFCASRDMNDTSDTRYLAIKAPRP